MGTSLDGPIALWYAYSAVANKILSLSLSLSLSGVWVYWLVPTLQARPDLQQLPPTTLQCAV